MSKDNVTRGKVVPDGLFYLIGNHSIYNSVSHVCYVFAFKTVISLKISCSVKKEAYCCKIVESAT